MKILIAEDDPFTRQALGQIIRTEGWEPVPAADGTAAWIAFQQGGFDLVCLDIMMPGISGYDLCRRIREKDALIPVLFISAKAEEIDKVLGLELGADDFIVKPFGVKEVAARLRAVMRRTHRSIDQASPETNQDFPLGSWTIQVRELRAKKLDKTVDLSPREVSILQVLVSLKGQAVDRVTLFSRCWGWDQAPQSRTLDQHLAVLRKKLEDDPGSPRLIRTVQGVGYRYEPE